jgi:hypothetical protein
MPKYGFMECLDNKKNPSPQNVFACSSLQVLLVLFGIIKTKWILNGFSLSLSLNKQAELVSNNNGVTFFSTKNGCPSSSQ